MLALSPVTPARKKVLILQAPARAHQVLGSAIELGFGIPLVSIPTAPSYREEGDIFASVLAQLNSHEVVAVACPGAFNDLLGMLAKVALPVCLVLDDGVLDITRFGAVAVRATLADLLSRVGVAHTIQKPQLRSRRLLLRAFRNEDRQAFIDMNGDPRVMQYLPSVLTDKDCDQFLERNARHFDAYGFGLWAVEAPGVSPFMGFVGLSVVGFASPFTPALQMSWRLGCDFWGHGYATEGARAVAAHAFESLRVEELVSFTVPANHRSLRVMERIGMSRDHQGDFDHPRLPKDHPLRSHLLFRLSRSPT